MTDGPYIIEYVRVGNQVKATAIDPETGTEASIFGPASASQKNLSDLAMKKLHYVMEKHLREGKEE